jgi:creatinine amidohydrolase/Fe(II)-dependent formamide hydrolase-like protein
MKPIGGARVAVTEGEGVIAGLHKLEEETAFGKYAKAAQAEMARARARGLREKVGGGGAGWAERPDGPAGRWADSAECEGKILF